MDYEFRRDLSGQVIAHFSMGHEAIGYWLNEEIKGKLSLIEEIESAAKSIADSENEWSLAGHEYTLSIDGQEVMIRANQLDFSQDELDEDMHYYDDESLSFCGITDFLLMLERYRRFIQESK
jgi:uncharacterized protein YacL (UPF0231 family)